MNVIGIILAAGRSSRFNCDEKIKHKHLLTINGNRLRDMQIEAFRKAGIHEIYTVTGFNALEIEADKKTNFIFNDSWSTENIFGSLLKAKSILETKKAIVAYGDVLFDCNSIRDLLNNCENNSPLILSDINWETKWKVRFPNPLEDAESYRVNKSTKKILEIGKVETQLSNIQGQFTGIFSFTPQSWASFVKTLSVTDQNLHHLDMTKSFQCYLANGGELISVDTESQIFEFDTQRDLIAFNEYNKKNILNDQGYINPNIASYIIQLFIVSLSMLTVGYRYTNFFFKEATSRLNSKFTSILFISFANFLLIPCDIIYSNFEFINLNIWNFPIFILISVIVTVALYFSSERIQKILYVATLANLINYTFSPLVMEVPRYSLEFRGSNNLPPLSTLFFIITFILLNKLFKYYKNKEKEINFFINSSLVLCLISIPTLIVCTRYKRNIDIDKKLSNTKHKKPLKVQIVLDSFSGNYQYLFNNSPQVLNDFSVYSNAYSTFPSTDLSIQSYTSAVPFSNGSNFNEWINKTNSQSVFRTAYEKGYDVKYYGYLSEHIRLPKLVDHISLWDEGYHDAIKNTFYMVYSARIFPNVLRAINYFRSEEVYTTSDMILELENSKAVFSQVIDKIKSGQISRGDFVYLHISIPHYPYKFDEYCSSKKTSTLLEQSKCSVTLIDTFISALKTAKLYSDSTIIIQSDHGNEDSIKKTSNYTEKTKARFHSLLMVKEDNTEKIQYQKLVSLNIVPSILFKNNYVYTNTKGFAYDFEDNEYHSNDLIKIKKIEFYQKNNTVHIR